MDEWRLLAAKVALNDVTDGVERVVGEVRRSGFEIKRLFLAGDRQPPTVSLILRVPSEADPALLRARFQRHAAVKDAVVELRITNRPESNLRD